MGPPSFRTPFVLTLAAAMIGIGAYIAGHEAAERQYSERAGQKNGPVRAQPAERGVSMDEALKIAWNNCLKLGVPESRQLVSLEVAWTRDHEMRYVGRLWPPWPVSQPEDDVRPLMWRAIEVTPAGRCYLTAVNQPGRDPAIAAPFMVPNMPDMGVSTARARAGRTILSQEDPEILYDWLPPANKRRVILPPPK